MVYGCYSAISDECQIETSGEFGYLGALFHFAKCKPWIFWVGANAGFHCTWVTTLTICQMYQVNKQLTIVNKQLFTTIYKQIADSCYEYTADN